MAEHHRFGKKSIAHLEEDLHYDMVRLCHLALKYTPYDFGITCALRNLIQQKKMVASGASRTLKSKHLPQDDGLSHAIDFAVYVNGSITWNIKYFRKVIQAFVRAAIELGIQVEFGGLWQSYVDGPHVELAFFNK